jgi:hypothetical protein
MDPKHELPILNAEMYQELGLSTNAARIGCCCGPGWGWWGGLLVWWQVWYLC